jgi:cobalamin biosynthesis protein CobC
MNEISKIFGEISLMPPHHGADLFAASQRYEIPVSDWLDVSTGINPCAYPFRDIDRAEFQNLPVSDDTLCAAAKNYVKSPVMPVVAAGSQVLIQWLPLVKTQLTGKRCRVAVPIIGYSEHAFRWQWAGHEIINYDPRQPRDIDAILDRDSIDVLILINAHNPLGLLIEPAQLLKWQRRLAQRGGWLIVDEAFVDPTPDFSVAEHAGVDGLIVLRSLGKFFGLAGARCGFAFCDEIVRERLRIAIGPWAVSGPTLQIATQALTDFTWQSAMRAQLQTISGVNGDLLQKKFAIAPMRHVLFNSLSLPSQRAIEIEDKLACVGIRVRRIEIDAECGLLRFGLIDPACQSNWQRFQDAINAIQVKR